MTNSEILSNARTNDTREEHIIYIAPLPLAFSITNHISIFIDERSARTNKRIIDHIVNKEVKDYSDCLLHEKLSTFKTNTFLS